MIKDLWNMDFKFIQIVISMLIFTVPSQIHKHFRSAYAPVYFAIFPFQVFNRNLVFYLGEDFFSDNITDVEAEQLRKKIIFKSALSVAISTIIIPCITGFLSSFFLDKTTFIQFIVLLFFYNLIRVIKSICQFRYYSVGSFINRGILSVVYFFYIGIVLFVTFKCYLQFSPLIMTKNWVKIFDIIANMIFGKIGVGILVVSILTSIFVSRITDRNIRNKNLQNNESNNYD